jgi:hypothetical protein
LWEDTEPEGRRAIAEAAFDRIEALGVSLTIYPSAEAEKYGWPEAFGHGPLDVPLAGSIGRYGRGERSHTARTDLNVPVPLALEIEVSGVERWARSSTV